MSQKYQLVNHWMLWTRGKEEIWLTKKEMLQYVEYLISTRNSLKKQSSIEEEEEAFQRGKHVLAAEEIRRLDSKIKQCIQKFNLHSLEKFFGQEETTNSESELEDFEFESDCGNESYFDSDSSESILLDSNNSDSEHSED